MINLSLLDNFFPVMSYRRIIVYGSVTRYGPQSAAGASGATHVENFLFQNYNAFLSFEYILCKTK